MLPRPLLAAAAAAPAALARRCAAAGAHALHALPRRHLSAGAAAAAGAGARPPTAVVLMNMGGPGSLDGPEDGVKPFLTRLFSDGEIIRLGPLQKWLVRRAARHAAAAPPACACWRPTCTRAPRARASCTPRRRHANRSHVPLSRVVRVVCAPRAPQGPYIANKRTSRIQKQYSEIGGKSPIGDWTRYQGERLAAKLNVRRPRVVARVA